MLFSPRPRRWISAGREFQDLTAELGADRAAGPGHQDALSAQVGRDQLQIELRGLSPEQVLDLHLSQVGDMHLAVLETREVGKDLESRRGVLADLHDLAHGLAARGGDRDEDVLDAQLLDETRNLVASAENGHAVDHRSVLDRIVVDESDGA